MPELPEVETTRRGLAPHLIGRIVTGLDIRQPRLRWPIPRALREKLPGQRIETVPSNAARNICSCTRKRAARCCTSRHVRLAARAAGVDADRRARIMSTGRLDSGPRCFALRLDPRRFGSQLWQAPGKVHPLLAGLGPEPLGDDFDGDHLWKRSRGRSAAVKVFLMDQAIVVGVGNIYASEALFAAGIHPKRAAGSISRARYARLADEIKRVLEYSITRGGTTLRDFINPDS